MEVSQQNNDLIVKTTAYTLTFHHNRPFVSMDTADGAKVVELFPFSSVHPLNGRDDTYQIGTWAAQENSDQIEVTITAQSTAWQNKTYRFTCTEQRFTYQIEVTGTGQLAEVLYFGGHYSASLRWSSGFFWSGQRFTQLFNPEPNIPEVFHLPPNAGTKIDITGVPIPAKGDWFFTPPPFCYAGQFGDQQWLAMGVEAQAGKNTYTEYGYHGNVGAFYLSLHYEGHTRVDGTYTLPAIGFDFALDEYAAVGAHVTALRSAGYTPIPNVQNTPPWWRTPIFCGWGAQCYLSTLDNGHAPNYARQSNYDHFMAALHKNDLHPGIVVLDDKWQKSYGENRVDEDKWHDLRGFINQQHALNRKVLLWYKAWDPEGLPTDECVTNAGGMIISVDPSSPAYEKRLRESIRYMLSPDGYDADGFKIDFTARIPSGFGLKNHEESIWGLELMKRYLSILYSEAKQVKPDALVMSHTPHPYLADVLDMIRLNDINMGSDVNRAMIHRAKIAALACPEAIIDTDNWPITDKATWRKYMEIQASLGVPSLYYATHIDATREPLDDSDYQLIREVWAESNAKFGMRNAK